VSDWRSLPFAPAEGAALCAREDVPDGGAKELVFGEGADCFRLLLLRAGPRVFGYHNRCPHFSIPPNYELVFSTCSTEVLMCAHHTAMFHIDNGACFDGLVRRQPGGAGATAGQARVAQTTPQEV
jgi:nitrite reductase/ring-hydroxylating ferredoxin subunit